MDILTYIIAIPFLYFNYKIVASDIKEKIIPNKYLGYILLLIPFWWAILFFWIAPSFLPWISAISPLLFSIQVVITFIVSFVLYYFWIWAAGDAKYLLVLSLFIPYIGIVPFIGNIALLTIVYLLGYFIYFYFGKLIFNKKYRQSLWSNIKQDLSDTWLVYKWNKWWKTYRIITKFLLVFFIIFVSIRLARIYLFNSVLENTNRIELFTYIIQKYNVYLIFLCIWVFIWWLYLFRLLLSKVKNYISNKLQINIILVWNMFLWALTIILVGFISYELANNYNEVSILLVRIFTLYLGIYILVKILIYSYKVTFGIGEVYYKDIKDLKEGDIVDKTWLIKMFWWRKIFEGMKTQSYIKSISYSLNKVSIKKIHNLYTAPHEGGKRKGQLNSVKIINTFSFWLYLYASFTITSIFWGKLYAFLVKVLLSFIT